MLKPELLTHSYKFVSSLKSTLPCRKFLLNSSTSWYQVCNGVPPLVGYSSSGCHILYSFFDEKLLDHIFSTISLQIFKNLFYFPINRDPDTGMVWGEGGGGTAESLIVEVPYPFKLMEDHGALSFPILLLSGALIKGAPKSSLICIAKKHQNNTY